MRIESIEYEELLYGWKLLETELKLDVTLLVGLSGAGKTRILNSIHKLRELATSDSTSLPDAIRWCIVFIREDGVKCVWKGETDHSESDYDNLPPYIVSETLTVNAVEVFQRSSESFTYRGTPTPPLSQLMSGFRLFAVDKDVAQVAREWRDLIFLHHGRPEIPIHPMIWTTTEYEEYEEKYSELGKLRSSDLSFEKRLYIACLFHPDLFRQIEATFAGAFPYTKKIVAHQFTINDSIHLDLEFYEKDVEYSLSFSSLSSGMINTFLLIAYCYLWPDGTVILIDEFESSMGMNCLDEATDLVLETSRRMQFILTSHHPYVINNIRPQSWKIVTRGAGVITTHNAAELGIGSSRHTSFTQLMNSKAFAEGILTE